MSDELKGLEGLLDLQPEENKYAQWGIEFNPFPRSGTSNINGSDEVNRQLKPLVSKTMNDITRFIVNALQPNDIDPKDQFISATIVGDYGSGKTQMLMYAKSVLNGIRDSETRFKPYTIYIDNPGGSIQEFIGNVIGKIGEENVRKYVWNHIIETIKTDDGIREQLRQYEPNSAVLFNEMKDSLNPYADVNTTSYKQFLDVFVRNMNSQKKRKFDDLFSSIVQSILNKDTDNSTVAYYFYEFISSDFGINKTWEALTSGKLKQMDGKEAEAIRYIVKLIKREGFTHVFILVDEFEDLTAGRLTKVQQDNYIHNLRILLDQHREWCLLFAINPHALERLQVLSPPLADRVLVRRIALDNLSNEEVKNVYCTYLSLAKYQGELPFTDEAIDYIRESNDGNMRRVLKSAYALFEAAADKGMKVLDKGFVENNMPTF